MVTRWKPNRAGLVLGVFVLALGVAALTRPVTAGCGPQTSQPPADSPKTPPLVGSTSNGMPAATNDQDLGVEELIAMLTNLKTRKAELEKREKELVETLKAKMQEQQKRLKTLGVSLESPYEVPFSTGMNNPAINY